MKIAFITGSRSEWGYIRPILRDIEQDSDLDYAIIVTNMHLSPIFGMSVQEIERDGFRIAGQIHMINDGATGTTGHTMTRSLAKLLDELPAVLEETAPDLLLLAGDRGEQLMGAIAAVHMGIPVAHIQCGELSGNVDGIIRHAITKLSHIHFAANDEFAERVRRLGEEDFRIHVTGAPLVDELADGMFDESETLIGHFGLVAGDPFILAVQHPVTEEASQASQQIEATVSALFEVGMPTLFILPNSDAGSHAIRQRLAQFENGTFRVVPNLPRSQYLGLLKMASVIVGNSSSGIMEAPTFGTPCVNIGRRQHGRLQSNHIINADYSHHAIVSAIQEALSPTFAATAQRVTNPYGEGGAAKRIVSVLKDLELTERLCYKQFTF